MKIKEPHKLALWTLRILALIIFFPACVMKFVGPQMMVHEFQMIGFGQWFRYFTASLELVGSVSVLIPRLSVYGAIVLLCVDIGAFFAQALVLHVDIIHTIVIALLLGVLIYFQRGKLNFQEVWRKL